MQLAGTFAPASSIFQRTGWVAFGALLALALAAAYSSLQWMVFNEWFGAQEYSHAPLIPLIAAYLVRQRADVFEAPQYGHAWGVALMALACMTILVGDLSTIHAVAQYGFLIAVFAAVGATFGIGALRQLALPLLILVFMVPLPNFLYQPLSSQLQLYSSQLGVAAIGAFGISVLLHGNVIDLGVYQLQVLEACNGLRYLFPLASLGFLFGYLFRGAIWQRVALFAVTVPITIALNSLRIAVIGVTVEHWGIAAAEGVLHQFEGWAVFAGCVVLLLAIAKLLARMNGRVGPLFGAFAIALDRTPATFRRPPVGAPWAIGACATLLAATLAVGAIRAHAGPVAPPVRHVFAEFPMDLGDGWRGSSEAIEQRYLDSLQLDDYLMADFVSAAGAHVNLYSAYYASQLAGRSAHSPRSCLPGDGWRITELSTVELTDRLARRVPVNRAVIARGNQTQLVYYWFEQRGRVLANEYAVKWYLLRDALDAQRTDGALVRLMTPVTLNRGIDGADAVLQDFFGRAKAQLPQFVPG